MKGAFQISREIFENPIWLDVVKCRLFFYIVGNAVFSHDGVKVGDITLKRGQYLRSYRNLQKDLQYKENRAIKEYSLSVIKKKVDELVKESRLKIEGTELGTLFTVCNYDRYQLLDNYKTELRTEKERSENGVRTQRERSENNNKNDKNDKNKKPSCHKFETCDIENAQLLFSLMQENNPDVKQPNFEKWASDFRLIRERDNRTDEQVKYLIAWSQQDDFWKGNILSPSKLRKQFDTLIVRVKAEKEKKGNSQPVSNIKEMEDIG